MTSINRIIGFRIKTLIKYCLIPPQGVVVLCPIKRSKDEILDTEVSENETLSKVYRKILLDFL